MEDFFSGFTESCFSTLSNAHRAFYMFIFFVNVWLFFTSVDFFFSASNPSCLSILLSQAINQKQLLHIFILDLCSFIAIA